MKIAKLHHKLNYSAWYLLPSYFRSLRESAESYEQQLPSVRSGEIEDFLSLFANQRPPMTIDANGIATISIFGVLGRDCAPIEKLLGLVDYEDINSEVTNAVESGAKAVLFDLDSPGGEAAGAAETAQKIAEIDIPKASFSSGMDCSACYFLSSSMDYKVASPSAQSGSIGTLLPWVDQSKLWDAFGLSWQPITGTDEDFKGAGFGPSLTDAQREHFQEQVTAMSAAFRDFVSNYRELDFQALQAGAYFGEQALGFNLIDKIGTYDQAYEWLTSRV